MAAVAQPAADAVVEQKQTDTTSAQNMVHQYDASALPTLMFAFVARLRVRPSPSAPRHRAFVAESPGRVDWYRTLSSFP